jgi:hypothetical protein
MIATLIEESVHKKPTAPFNVVVSLPESLLWNFPDMLPENLPFPSLAKRGENHMEKNSSLKKGDEGGFKFDFSSCHCLDSLNELLKRHPKLAR